MNLKKTHILNQFLTIKLENDEVNLYINRKKFSECIVTPIEIKSKDSRNVQSIDSLLYGYAENDTLDIHPNFYFIQDHKETDKISLEEQFWIHCSNFQAWIENDYNTNILDINLSFPILKKLAELKDKKAIKVFKEEIAKRISSGFIPVIKYLFLNNYLEYLNGDEKVVAIQNLKKIDLSRCNLTKIPKFVFSAENLRELYLFENNINEIPDRIKDLRRLRILDLGSNDRISRIPNSFKNLVNLEELYVDVNNLEYIPKFIGNLKSLKILGLGENEIKEIPPWILRLINLKELYLNSNNISEIPVELADIKGLTHLDLSNNKIRHIPINLLENQNIQFFNLKENPLEINEKLLEKNRNLLYN